MIKRIFIIIVSFLFFIFCNPIYAKEDLFKSIDNYMIKISNKFSRTYCNTKQFGISEEGALAFAIGETNKEFKNKKLNNLIDYKLLKNKILVNLENNCKVYDFPIEKLEKLVFK